MLDEEAAQIRHVALTLVQLYEVGGDKRGARVGAWTRPIAIGGPLGELVPRQITDEGAIVLDERIVGDPGGQRSVGMGERAGDVGRRRGASGLAPGQAGAQVLERGSEIE